MNKIFFLLMFFLLYGFNWNKCDRFVEKAHPVTSVFYALSSSASFTTSTGPCAMIGELEHDKKLFIVQNYEELKLDVAMGGGKTLEGYASLSKVAYSDDLKKSLQMSYANIFKSNELDVEGIYRGLECQMSQKDACVI